MSRRALLVSAAAALTSACGDSNVFKAFELGYDLLFGDGPKNPLSREQIEQYPYALIEVRIGKPTVGVLVLLERRGEDLEWTSTDSTILHTRSWRLVKTAGLPVNIARTEFVDDDPVATGLQTIQSGSEAQRIVDFSDIGRYGRLVKARFDDLGPAPIDIIDLQYPTRLMRETNYIEIDDWEYENFFWFDPQTGVVWRSLQHVDPSFPPLQISILKPPAANV